VGNRQDLFQFGAWVIEPQLSRIRSGQMIVHLEPKAIEVLGYLLDQPGEIVSQQELIDVVWNGRLVEPAAVTRNIAEIRKALGDDPRNPTYIQTVPKRGYRTIAMVTPVAQRLPRSIAVLPFVNMSNDPDQEFFSDGIAEDILNELARNTSLTVRPRASTFVFRGANIDLQAIGRRLDVSHLVDGSVRRSGKRVRVTVQLSEVSSNRSLWSQRFDRELTDIFVVQDEITREVLAALNLQLVKPAASRKFVSDEAYEAHLLGRYHVHRFELPQAISWFKVAVELDPANADAWAQLARINSILASFSVFPNTGENRRERSEYIERALAIDPTHPLALAVKAWDSFTDRNYQASIDQFVNIVLANPNHPEAHLFLAIHLQDIDEPQSAIRAMKRFRELDQSPNADISAARQYVLLGRIDDAHRALDAYRAKWNLVQDIVLALTEFELAFAEGDPDGMQTALDSGLLRGHPMLPVWSALVPYLRGDHSAVEALLKPLTESDHYVPNYVISYGSIVEGRLEEAVTHWRAGVLAREPIAVRGMIGDYVWRKTFPEFYEHPDYQKMLVEFGRDAESKITVPELPF